MWYFSYEQTTGQTTAAVHRACSDHCHGSKWGLGDDALNWYCNTLGYSVIHIPGWFEIQLGNKINTMRFLINNHQYCGYNDWVGKSKYYDKKNSLVSPENDIQEKTTHNITILKCPEFKRIYTLIWQLWYDIFIFFPAPQKKINK